jgi:hypothetical protein
METLEYGVCECGNRIDYKDMGDGAECCEWCLPENRFDGIMWRERGDILEQMETHGMDRLHWVRFVTGEEVTVWANSFEIAEYIAGEWLAQQEVNA